MSHRENSLGLPICTLSAVSRQGLVQGQSLLLSLGNGWAHLLFVPLSLIRLLPDIFSVLRTMSVVFWFTPVTTIFTHLKQEPKDRCEFEVTSYTKNLKKNPIWYAHYYTLYVYYYTYLYHLPPILAVYFVFFQNSQSKLYSLMKFSAKHLYKSLHPKSGGGGGTCF